MVWTIRNKLIALAAVSVLSTLILGSIAFIMLAEVGGAVGHTSRLSSAIRLQGDADMMHDAIYGNVLAGMLAANDRNNAAYAEAAGSFAQNAPRFRRDLSALAKVELGAPTRAKMRDVTPVLDGYIQAAEEFFRQPGAAPADLRPSLARVTQAYVVLAGPMEQLSDSIEEEIAGATADLAAKQRMAHVSTFAAIVLSTLVIAIAGWSIYRAIHGPLSTAIQAVHTVAGGDLRQKLPEGRRDEIGELLNSLNDMRQSLGNMFCIFQSKAAELDGASGDLVQASARVSGGSVEQRDASESIAATLEEMNGSIDAVADAMHDAQALAQRLGDASVTGGRAIEALINDMSRIEISVKDSASAVARLGEESKHIGEVVNVIREIAEQTNLLALNAAIEAARAGEQGRGFAVVADEVRKLAERTANATEQIGTMIQTILSQVASTVGGTQAGVEMVEAGARSAEAANVVLGEITEGVRNVVVNVSQAADAMREQAAGVQQVTCSAEKITGMAEVNSQVSAEAEQAARALSTIADTLRITAATFKVEQELAAQAA